MDVAGFIARFRSDTKDDLEPYKWSSEDVIAYLNDALNEACERALLIEDEEQNDATRVALVANQALYPLHQTVIRVKEVRYRGRLLVESSIEAEAAQDELWRTRQGVPRRCILSQDGALRIVPHPTDDLIPSELELTVYRRELQPRDARENSGPPELNARYHERLLNWMLFRAYSVKDSETLDVQRAADYERLFTRDFGERLDANVQRKIRDRRPPRVRMVW